MIPNFNTTPTVEITGRNHELHSGWEEIARRLNQQISGIPGLKKVVVVECYQGVHEGELLAELSQRLSAARVIHSSFAFRSEEEIRSMTRKDVTDDRIFGYLTSLNMEDFLEPGKAEQVRNDAGATEEGVVLIIGPGASLLYPECDVLVYADMARWEIQLRMRRNEVANLGINNFDENIEGKYKRGYFVDWRVCDRLKRRILPHSHWILDTNRRDHPVMLTTTAFFDAMEQVVRRPFSVVPYFDAGPWGGQWMKETFNLPSDAVNYAWCFNCVPEENSLYLDFGCHRFETPAINVVFFRPDELLGGYVRERFGEEFPIRFDFLDTMGGGNLSLQVHPLTEYIREQFGQSYTQDESYYLVEAGKGARVYLGLKEGVEPANMARDLRNAERGEGLFDDTLHVQSWPAMKHDHFLIPGGTVHCSGKDCMVLEISATPYIFTFKLWDWGRLGLDGKPRPINISHGLKNIQWNRTETWVRENLVNQIHLISRHDDYVEEHTGLHELEFIETRRHRFTNRVNHHTGEGVNVICLVEGREVLVESPTGAFQPFVVHYAETFIVPASVGDYTIKPYGEAEGKECVTVKAYVRRE